MSRASRRRREATIRKLQEAAGTSRDLAEHIHDRLIRPQQIVNDLRKEGQDVEIAFVSAAANATGFLVTCESCGRTGRLPFKPPPDKVALCPDCIKGK